MVDTSCFVFIFQKHKIAILSLNSNFKCYNLKYSVTRAPDFTLRGILNSYFLAEKYRVEGTLCKAFSVFGTLLLLVTSHTGNTYFLHCR